ncbi:hypothetical protein KCU76_g91, partial [Aureobasidium melanogenum]
LSKHTAASTLREKREHISHDKNLGEEFSSDQRAGFSSCEVEDTAKFHVYACCKEALAAYPMTSTVAGHVSL